LIETLKFLCHGTLTQVDNLYLKILYGVVHMKTLSLLAALMFSFSALSQERACLSSLTQNFSVNSRAFVVDLDEEPIRDYGSDYLAHSIAVIRNVIDKIGCSRQDINFGKGLFGRSRHSCKMLVPHRELARVCYVETNLGAFIVTNDFLDHAHVIFKRWD
jgi:hypothetical protein